jgi:ribosomal protein L4
MANSNNRRRFFAVKAAIAKKAANDNQVVFCGRTIKVNDDNAQLVEFIREADAQAAYEAACMGTVARQRIAA